MRPMRHWWFVLGGGTLLWVLTGCNLAWEERAARTGTVEGRITSTTGRPIAWQRVGFETINVPGVTVFNEPAYMTGPQGEYGMRLYAGVYDIRVRDPNAPDGWQRQRVTVLPMQVTRADFTIERSIPVPHLGQVPHCAEAVPTPTRVLGRSVGGLGLGMSPQEVHAVLGEPRLDFALPGVHRRWIFHDGTQVSFVLMNNTDVVQHIITSSATIGATVEGLSIGDTLQDFARTYQNFSLCTNSLYGFRITGTNNVGLGVSFNEEYRVIGLALRDYSYPENPGDRDLQKWLESGQ